MQVIFDRYFLIRPGFVQSVCELLSSHLVHCYCNVVKIEGSNNCTIAACNYAPKRSSTCIFCLFSAAANLRIDLRIGCESVESPSGAIIAQQSYD